MSRSPATRLVLAAIVGLAVIGCTGSTAPTAPSPSTAPVAGTAIDPVFDLDLDGAVELSGYHSDPAAGLNTCAPGSGGGWTYLYGGGEPFVTVDISLFTGAMDGSDPSDFDLDIVASGRAVRLVPSGREEGVQGTGTARLTTEGGIALIAVDGTAVTLEGGPVSHGDTDVHLTLRCADTRD